MPLRGRGRYRISRAAWAATIQLKGRSGERDRYQRQGTQQRRRTSATMTSRATPLRPPIAHRQQALDYALFVVRFIIGCGHGAPMNDGVDGESIA